MYAQTINGKTMPLDADQNGEGNVVIREGRAHVLKKAELAQPGLLEDEPRFMPHFATCTNWK